MSHDQVRAVHILLVDDDDDDVDLITKTLERDQIPSSIFRVRDGTEAMSYLRKQDDYSQAVRPDLMLLDLNMPRMCGREVLKKCREDDTLETIPIVVFTSSDDEKDILASYKYQANSYVTKPVNLLMFREVLQELSKYWSRIVTLPPHEMP